MEKYTPLGRRILFLMDQKKLEKIKDFCNVTNISGSSISKVLRYPEKDLSMDQFKKIMHCFDDVNFRWLIWGEGEAFLPKWKIDQITTTNNGTVIGVNNGIQEQNSANLTTKNSIDLEDKIKALETKIEIIEKYNKDLLAIISSKIN